MSLQTSPALRGKIFPKSERSSDLGDEKISKGDLRLLRGHQTSGTRRFPKEIFDF
jgi:hypothetical protein